MTDWTGRRALVTGAGGFIASHLVDRLAALGARVRAFVHYRADGSWGLLEDMPCKDRIEVVAGDVRDAETVVRAMDGVEVVFHLAAVIAIPYSYQAPSTYVATNVQGTVNVLQAARAAGVARVVHTSTSEVYGTVRTVPIREDHPLQGQSPYAATKIGADKLAESFFLSFETPVVTVRPFNTFGPGQSARAVIPTIITQCLAGKAVRLGSLHPTRDLNYVGNTVEGFVKAATAPGVLGRTLNLGSGREVSIGDLARLIADLLGTRIEIVTDAQRVRPAGSEVERLLADTTLARELLDWEPTVTLEDGLKRTIEWIRAHLDRYRPETYAV